MSRSNGLVPHGAILASLLILVALFLPAPPADAGQIARTVGTSGDFAVVASFDDATGTGEVRILERNGVNGTLEESQVLLRGRDLSLPYSVSIDGDQAIVGDPNEGRVHLFTRDAALSTWTATAIWTVKNGKRDAFGSWVRLDGGEALVGAAGSGRVHVFRPSGDRWREASSFSESDDEAWSGHAGARPFFERMIESARGAEKAAYDFEDFFVNASDDLFEDRVEVRWPAAPEAPVWFEVYRSGELLTFAASTESLYVDYDGQGGAVYSYEVLVVDAASSDTLASDTESGWHEINAPEGLTASKGTFEDRIRLEWTDRSRVEVGYRISRDGMPLDTIPADRTWYEHVEIPPPPPELPFIYSVSALDAAGDESDPAEDEGWTGFIVPPLDVDASDGQIPDYVRITWRDQSTRELFYEVFWDGAPIPWVPVEIPPDTGKVVALVYEAFPGVVHEYCVVAVDSSYHYSPFACDSGGIGVLPSPANVNASNGTYDDKVRVTWSDPSGTEDGFRIYRRKLSEADSTLIDSTAANTTAYDDFTAEADTFYRYCVAAFADSGGVSAAVCADSGRRAVVLPPTFVEATDGEHEDRVVLSWESPSAEVVMFKIYRDGVPFRTVPAYRRSVVDTAIASGVVYDYCIRAVAARGYESPLSCDTTGGSRRLLPPPAVQASDHAYEDEVRITWVDKSGAEEGYRIYRRPEGASVDTLIATRTANRTAYVDRTGVPGVDYLYSVAAYDFYGESDRISDGGGRALKAPAGLTASQGKYEDRIALAWEDSSRAETGYRIYRIETDSLPAPAQLIDSTAADTRAFVDSAGIDFGVDYTYLVVAHDSVGESAADTASGYTAILAPGSFRASRVYDDRVILAWTDESRIETGYEISRNDTVLASVDSNVTSYTDLSVAPGTKYRYCATTYSGMDRAAACDSGIAPSTADTPPASVGIVLRDVLFNPAAEAYTRFGLSVAAGGDFVVVGAPSQSSNGRAYVYRRTESGWALEDTLRPSATNFGGNYPADGWGTAVATDGNRIAVWADSLDPDPFFPRSGWCQVFERNGQSWETCSSFLNYHNDQMYHKASLAVSGKWFVWGGCDDRPGNLQGRAIIRNVESGPDLAYPTEFNDSELGYSVSICDWVATDGEWVGAIVGAPGKNFDQGEFREYVGQLSDGPNAPYLTYTASDAADDDRFGHAVCIDRTLGSDSRPDFLFVGAPGRDVPGYDDLGAVYVFRGGPGAWDEAAILIPEPDTLIQNFGSSLSYEADMLVVGADASDHLGAEAGCAFLFRRDGESWIESGRILPGEGTVGDRFGRSVAISEHAILVGMPYHDGEADTNTGSVLHATRMSYPRAVSATDGTLPDRVRINWERGSYNADGFRVYREGELLQTVGPEITLLEDYEAVPGRSYEYEVVEFNEYYETISSNLGVSLPITDFGRRPPDGSIGGRVTSRGGAGVVGARVCLDPSPNTAILLDGERGRVFVDSMKVADLTEFTVEFWNRNSAYDGVDGETRYLFSYGDPSHHEIEIEKVFLPPEYGGGARIYVRIRDFPSAVHPISNDGEWHHLAIAWRLVPGGLPALVVWEDGQEVLSYSGFYSEGALTGGGRLALGGEQSDINGGWARGFLGEMDDFRIWNKALTEDQVRERMYSTLTGSEDDLVGYWPLDQEGGSIVADMSHHGNYGRLEGGVYWADDAAPLDVCSYSDLEGNYTLSDLRYGTSLTFEVTPALESRAFQPAFKRITLSKNSPVQNEVEFTDVTSYTVSGRVRYAGTDCFVPNVQIKVDGLPKAGTDENGTFSLALEAGEYVIEPEWEGHEIYPLSRTITVTGNRSDVNFVDSTAHAVSGRVGGGSGDCSRPVGDIVVEIRSTETACFVRTDTLSAADSVYAYDLPPMKYSLEVLDVLNVPGQLDRVDVLRFFRNLGEREIDLAEADTTLAFVYRAPLRVTIEGFPEPDCPAIGVPIIAQLDRVPLTIRVEEDYGARGFCPLDSGFVVVYDEIIDQAESPETVTVKNGIARYATAANTPNVYPGRLDAAGNDRSYQKKLTVRAVIEGQTPTEKNVWVVVTGHKARTGTFVTGQSEPILAYVLRDPPGDASYAYLEKGTTLKHRWGDMDVATGGAGTKIRVKSGLKFEKGVGVSTESKGQLIMDFRLEIGGGETIGTEYILTTTLNDRLATSADGEFVGDDSDVYVGHALNVVFAEADEISIEGCQIRKFPILAMQVDTTNAFPTQFAFTGFHIRDALIPQLERLRDTLDTGNATFYQNSIDNWREMQNSNQENKEQAQFEDNRSFAAGADYEFTNTVSHDTTKTSETLFYFDFMPMALNGQYWTEESGNGIDVKWFTRIRGEFRSFDDSTFSYTHTVGYTLSDDDIGDYFSVDVMRDEGDGGGPIFKLRSGRSSCPWEPGTQARDGSVLYIDPPVRSGISPDGTASFVLTMVNASESGERREYMIVPDLASNPGGAIIRLNGDPFSEGTEGDLFVLDPGDSYEATITVERGPIRYSYPNLGITMVPTCEYERYRRGLPYFEMPHAANVTFSVDFEAPCSDVTLFEPEDHWTHGAGDGDTLLVTLADFDLAVSLRDTVLLQSVGAEYRPAGTDEDWDDIGTVVAAQIDTNPDGTPQSVEIPWNVGIVPDGLYEVRAFTACENALERVHSLTATGTIDRAAPKPLGTPEPADRMLTVGDDISITFDEPVRCLSIDLDEVRLAVLDPDVPNDTLVTISTACDGRTIVITPTAYGERTGLDSLEGKTLRMRVAGVRDIAGNAMIGTDGSPVQSWEFEFRKSSFTWAAAAILEDVPYRSPASMVATLVNAGSKDVDFEITGLAGWLATYPGAGTIRAGETIDISFLVADTLPQGSHTDVVVAVARDTSGAIVMQSPLRIRADVACRAPEWAVDPEEFQHTMTVILEGTAEGAPLGSTADLVAAYVGNQIRGTAGPILVDEPFERHLFFLTVRSDRTSGETVRFRAWGADSCRTYGAADRTIPFVADAIHGTVDSPEAIAFSGSPEAMPGAIALRDGWTWFSLQTGDAERVAVADVLSDLTPSEGDLIKSRTEYAQFDGDSGWVGDLDSLDRTQTYMIRVTGGGTIYHPSLEVPGTSVPIPVIDGWNWIGYIPDVTYPVNEAFANLVASTNDVVKSPFGFAEYVDTGSVAGEGRWIGTLGALAPGGGYKLYLSDASSTGNRFFYPGGVATGTPSEPDDDPEAGGPGWSLAAHGFQHTMTVTAVVQLGEEWEADETDLVAAFVDGEVRGVSRPQQITALNKRLTFLVIHSDRYTGEEVTFQVYDADRRTTFEIEGTISFEANKVVGTVRDPYRIEADGAGDSGTPGVPRVFELAQNEPNPFNPKTVIRCALPTEERVVLRVYNVAGRHVATPIDGKRPAGWHQFVIDADRWASGVYFYRLEAGPYHDVRKMTLVK